MAAEKHSSTRRRVLGAAAVLPVLALTGLPAPVIASVATQSNIEHERWHRRLARYRRLHACWKAEAETGAFRQANDAYARARAALIARFGSWEKARRSRTGKPLCQAAFRRIDTAETVYYDRCTAPMHRAAIRLAVTPAPDLRALLAKLEVIREHGLEEFDDMPQPALGLVRRDLQRLTANWGQSQ